MEGHAQRLPALLYEEFEEDGETHSFKTTIQIWRVILKRECRYQTCLLEHARNGVNTSLSAQLIITG
jgi:hypothetical protein